MGSGGRDLVLVLVALGAGCSARAPLAEVAATAMPATVPARPAACQEVAAGADLQAAVDAAPAGGALCLGAGVHLGPVVIARPLVVWGPRAAIVRTRGAGTTIRVTGTHVELVGFTVDGSGGRADLLDAAVHLGGDDHRVAGLHVVHAPYGLLAEKSRRTRLVGNLVEGDAHASFGRRGDPIRLWETTDSLVEGNRVDDGRDVVVWYSSRNRVVGNHVRGGRYGTHLMYSHDNVVEGNVYEQVVVGVFVMYSHGVTLRDNLVANARGATGIGIGLKDSGDVTIVGNRLVQDAVGIYLDNSPSQLGQYDHIEGNELRRCDVAIAFHSSGERNVIRGNLFADNQAQARTDGGGDTRAVTWDGNHFDDYEGYDLDGDGVGDVPYELRSAEGELVARRPELAFFHGTPTLGLADAASRLLPLMAPAVLVVDRHPRMAPFTTEVTHAP